MIALALSLSLAATAAPPPPVAEASTLQEFLQSADKRNVDRQLSRQQVVKASADFQQAWMGLLPYFTGTAGYTWNQYPASLNFAQSFQPFLDLLPPGVVDPAKLNALTSQPPTTIIPRNQLDAGLRFDLPIIDPARWARISGTDLIKDGTMARDDLTGDNVKRAVLAAYYGYVAALAVRDSAQKTQGVAEEQLKLTQARVNVGSGTELDALRAKAEVERARQTIADADAVVATSARSLETLSGKRPVASIAMPQPDLRPEPSVEELEQSVVGLPAMRAATLDVKTNERGLLAARLAIMPTVGGWFLERFTNATGFQGKNTLASAGVSLVWRIDVPTFQGMAVQAAATELARLQAEKTRLASRDQINSDWQRLNAALIKVKAAAAQVEAAQRASQVARDRYAVGATTQLELIQSDRDLFGAEVAQIQAKTELALARASLRISSGRSLD